MHKIAIPTDNGNVAAHFGRCPQFTLVEVENDEITEQNLIDNPGHKPGFLPRFLNEQGADCIIASGMGRKAKNIFDDNNIEVVTGASGPIAGVVESYIQDRLDTEENICDHDHSDHDHDCH
ncbi:MAG: NifB/NifX family molybdenum-iron cluster-binding protein [Bacillota bacterium]